ncbi:MAG: hypothetical protein RL514_1271 [Verrucomicrobiota bacterium]
MADDGSQTPNADPAKAKKPTVRIDIAKLTRELAGARPPTAPTSASATPVAASTFRPLPATLPPGSLDAVLHALLREHGARVYESRRLFRSFMADALAGREHEHLLAVNTMALLAEEGVPVRLIAAKSDKLAELLQHEAASLSRQHALQPAALTEALRCWAAALRPEVGPAIATPAPKAFPVPVPAASTPASATTSSPWENSLGMKFAPVPGTAVLFSIWATRKQDYAAYANSRPGVDQSWENVSCKDQPVSFAPDHPVVCVSWDDAKAFCLWLTEKERREGRLLAGASYRLPTDWEWSMAVGLSESRAGSPFDKSIGIQGGYPWGTQWPPPDGAGNYADITAASVFGSGLGIIEGYWDGHATTAPVGSFTANQLGLYDLGGNVWEWCEDFYDGKAGARVLRGCAWDDFVAYYMLSSSRLGPTPDFRSILVGFRVVLVGGGAR